MAANQLDVRPSSRRLSGEINSNVSLSCLSSLKPVLCLWKTPYGHVYTLSQGVFAESGRLRPKKSSLRSSTSPGETNECGLEIVGIEERDAGQWECEVGAVVGEDFKFKTSTAKINLAVKGKQNNDLIVYDKLYIPVRRKHKVNIEINFIYH